MHRLMLGDGDTALRCPVDPLMEGHRTMPRYRVTLRRTTVEIVEAANPYQAAIAARDLGGEGDEIAVVVPAVGRPSNSSVPRAAKKAAKRRRPMSPETRAKLAKNLVKARAARAANQKKASRTTKAAAARKKRVSTKKR